MTDEVLDFMQARENNTVAGVIGPVLDEEHNVDDANRAVELSRATGVPSNVIYPNVKEFDKQNQTAMIAQLLRQDAKLREFADSQPIVPKIATNDWGSLAKASRSMTRMMASPIAWATTKEGQEVWKAAFEGAKEGWGPDTPFYVTEQGIKNVEWAKRNVLLWSMFYYGGLAFEGTMRGVSAAVGAGAEGMGKLAEVATGSEKAGEEVKKGIHVAAEYAMTDLPAMQLLHARQMRMEQDAARLQPLKDAAYAAKPWIDAGVEPPVGVHPFIDELKKAKAKNDIRMLDEAIRDFDAIPMKKSAPEILAELPKSHTDKEIGISAEAVRKLYGDAKPEPGDGKLGWVPELESRLRAAELSNGDVNVPLAEYVARVDKATHDELKEDIRFHDEGVTLNEAKELVGQAADIEAFHGSPHEFDAFSMEKIGTGEGAQSYGHGLYFAENPAVAESYKAAGRRSTRKYKINGREVDAEGIRTPSNAATPEALVALFMDITGSRAKALEAARYEFSKAPDEVSEEAVKILESGEVEWLGAGNQYRVRIRANKEDFLDWDKPLSQQSPTVQEALKKIGRNSPDMEQAFAADYTGQETHDLFVRRRHVPAEDMAGHLKRGGIPGIKYLDQGSRAQAEGTHNFVLFDESLIDILDRNGEAVRAVRQQGDFKPLLDEAPSGWNKVGELETSSGKWEKIGGAVEAKIPEAWTPVHDKIIEAVAEYLGHILPNALEGHIPALSLRVEGKKVSGLFTEYRQQKPIIFWALDAPDIFGTARHEAIHALRRGGYLTEQEWNILARAVRDEQLIDLYNIDERYPDASPELKIEEAVAEHFKYWDRTSKEIKSGPVKEIFEKLKRIKDGVYSAIAKVWGKEPTVHEIFGKIESGEVGAREGKSITPGAFGSAMDVGAKAGETVEEKAMATAKALGLSEREMKIYQQRIAKQNDELMEFTKRRAMEDETRRQTAEWKAEAKAVRQEVLSDTEKMPDLVAENYFRNGEYLGQKLAHKPKIDPAGLSDYEKRALPKGITAPGGADPDTIASLLGFNSGKEMLSALSELEHARGEMPMGEFLKQKIDAEVARRMEERHGDLAENILAEAREHVLSQTQLDIMHQETLAMAAKAGAEFTFTLDDIKGWIKDEFANTRAQGIKASRYVSEAGRAGRRMEKALLEGGFGDAFKEAQHRQFAALFAKEAAKFEKEVKKADKIMSRFQRRPNIKSIAQPYTDQAQALILQVGEPIRRTQENLQLSLQGKTFQDFMAERNGMGDGILDPNLPPGKKFSDFTVDEYRDFAATLKSLDYNGRKAKTIEKENQAFAHELVIEGITENLDKLAKEGFDPTKGRVRKTGRWLDAKLVKAEQLIDWIDENDPRGWFNQTTSRILFAAQHKKGDVIADLAQMFKKIPVDRAWGRNLDARVENRYLRGKDGEFMPLTHENKIVMALNFGNKSNRSVLLRGYDWKIADVQQFLNENMTEMDWNFVKGVWDVFKKIGPLVEEATTKRSGVPIEMVQPTWFDTPHGRMPGGYYPLIKDAREALLGEQRKHDLVDKPFFDPLPMSRSMNLRTGVAYPIDLTMQSMANRINETVHAALFQDPVRNAQKVIGDPAVRKGIDKAFGPEYVKELDAWLKDIANNGGEHDDWSWISRNLRENVVFGLMGYKLSTAAIHALSAGVSSAYEIGPLHLAKNLKRLGIAQVMPGVARKFFANSDQMWKQVDWAQETFPELRNRMQIVGRDMQAQISNIVSKGFWDDAARIRAANIVWSMKMVATLDQLTATPVAIAAYTKAISEGTSHADAVYIGDKAVRQAHGSPSLVGRANIGRGEVQKWLTVAYNGYWNHNYNRTRTAIRDVKNPDIEYSTRLSAGSAALVAFIIAPALIHYGIRGSENKTWTGAIAEALLSQFGGQIPVINSLTHAFMHNRDPHVSPADDVLKHATDVQKDVVAKANGGKAEKFVRHVLETPGFFLGLGASSQIATAIQFQVDVAKRKEIPESIFDWARGTITGHTKANTPRKH